MRSAALAVVHVAPEGSPVAAEIAQIPGAEANKLTPSMRGDKRVAVRFNQVARQAAAEAPHQDYTKSFDASDNLRWTLSTESSASARRRWANRRRPPKRSQRLGTKAFPAPPRLAGATPQAATPPPTESGSSGRRSPANRSTAPTPRSTAARSPTISLKGPSSRSGSRSSSRTTARSNAAQRSSEEIDGAVRSKCGNRGWPRPSPFHPKIATGESASPTAGSMASICNGWPIGSRAGARSPPSADRRAPKPAPATHRQPWSRQLQALPGPIRRPQSSGGNGRRRH